MTYDNYGNILTKDSIQYCYDDANWPDRLTCYDNKEITYDAQGNPTHYLGNTLTWEKGRQLKSFCENTYTYNANGIRTSKTTADGTHTYTLDGSKILKETWGDNVLVPLYDTEETVCGIIYNKQAFYFQKNLQGDIIGITNASGTAVARYNYDAWGVCTTAYDTSGCAIATVNPFRYRGYYYDPEIGMYYLQSRYYDPVVGRFINADDRVGVNCGIISYALYTYCGNAPVHLIDPSGYAWWVIAICVLAVAHVVNAVHALSQADYNKSHDVRGIVHNQYDVDMKLGCKSFASVGCGAAATHNAILLAGGSSSLAEVVEFMQARDLTLGFAGVYLTNIWLYLERKGYYTTSYLLNLHDIDSKIKYDRRKIAILAYKHPKSGHYVAIQYNKKSKKFDVYNTDMHISSVDQWIKENSYTPLSLITM